MGHCLWWWLYLLPVILWENGFIGAMMKVGDNIFSVPILVDSMINCKKFKALSPSIIWLLQNIQQSTRLTMFYNISFANMLCLLIFISLHTIDNLLSACSPLSWMKAFQAQCPVILKVFHYARSHKRKYLWLLPVTCLLSQESFFVLLCDQYSLAYSELTSICNFDFFYQ